MRGFEQLRTIALPWFVSLCLLFGTGLAFSDDGGLAKEVLKRGTSPTWFNAETGEWTYPEAHRAGTNEQSIASRDKYIYQPPPPTSTGTFWQDLFRGMADFFGEFIGIVAKLLLILAIVGIIAFLVMTFIKGTANPFDWRKSQATVNTLAVHDPAKIVDLPFSVEAPSGDLLGQADAFRRNGDYARSIVYLFGHVLVELDSKGLIHLQRGKTNRMYLRELKHDSELTKYQQYLIQVFEAVFFGRYTITQEICDRCWDLLPGLNEAIAKAVAVRQAGALPPTPTPPTVVDVNVGTASLGWLMLATMLAVGCTGEKFPSEAYGESKHRKGRTALGGLGLFVEFCEGRGLRTFEQSILTPRAYKLDAIVWAPKDFRLPNQREQNWFNDWLADGSKRTLIFVGRDYSPSGNYWKKAAASAQPADRAVYRFQQGKADNELTALFEDIGADSCDWFQLDDKKVLTRDVKSFQGPWSKSMSSLESHVVLRRTLSPKTERWKQTLEAVDPSFFAFDEPKPPEEESDEPKPIDRGRPTVEHLLKSDQGEPLVWQMRYKHWGESRIVVLANASLVANEGMTMPGNQHLAGELLKDLPAKSRVGFLSNFGKTLVRNPGDPAEVSGFELLRVWPLSLISMHGLIVGFVAMLALWPIFGRPQRTPSPSTTDFGKHIEALGDLLYLSKDRQYALSRIADYFREVRGDLSSEWSKRPAPATSTVPLPPAPQPPIQLANASPLATSEASHSIYSYQDPKQNES